MGIIARQALKSSLATYFGILLGYVNKIFLFTRFLSQEQIGLIALITEIGSFTGIITSMGSGTAVNRFFPRYKDNKEQRATFYKKLTIQLGFGLLICTVLLYFLQDFILSIYSSKLLEKFDFMVLVFPVMVYFAIFPFFKAISIANLRLTVPTIINDVFARAIVFILLLIFAYNTQEFITIYFWHFVVVTICLMVYCFFKGFYRLNTTGQNIAKKERVEINKYRGLSVLSAASGMMVNKVDILMINSISLAWGGVYSIMSFIAVVSEIPVRTISQMSNPVIARAIHDKNKTELLKVYRKSSLNQLILCGGIFMMIWVNLPSFIDIFIPDYSSGLYVFLFLAFAKTVNGVFGPNEQIIVNSEHYRVNFFITIFLIIVAITSNQLLIPKFQLTGAAIATSISYLTVNLIKFVIVQKKFGIQPFQIATIKVCLLLSFCFAIDYFIPNHTNLWLDMTFRTLGFGAFYGGIIYFGNYSSDLNEMVHNFSAQLGLGKRVDH